MSDRSPAASYSARAPRWIPPGSFSLIQNEPGTYRLRDATRLSFTAALSHPEARFEFVEQLLAQIAPDGNSRIAATA